jgi:hypothetical protein
MPSNYEEQIALQGTLISRPESPALEGAAANAIEEAFQELIERRYLYQKLTVDFGRIDAAVKQAVDEAMMRASTPSGRAVFIQFNTENVFSGCEPISRSPLATPPQLPSTPS